MQAFSDITDVGHFIHGQRVNGSGTRNQPVFNPATGASPRKLLLGETADVEAAVASAKSAFPKWSNTPPIRRARVMLRFLELILFSSVGRPENAANLSLTRG